MTSATPRGACAEIVLHGLADARLVKHSEAAGGVLIDPSGIQRLTPIQFSLLELLALRRLEDADKPSAVRGFIPSYELLCSLPWECRAPEDGNVKQLVRRVRRRLRGTQLRLEARHGLGYRITGLDRAARTQSATPGPGATDG